MGVTRGVVAALLLTVTVTGCGAPADERAAPSPSSTVAPSTTTADASPSLEPTSIGAAPGTALATLETLRVAGRGAKTGYARAEFGAAWLDVDRNGCDTRNDILARDLTQTTVKPGTNGCVVLTGRRDDPYTGRSIAFVRGGASELDIDHVVALGNAWVSGAARWAYGRKVAFANDPLNLLAVDSSANRQKGDGDAATWVPPDKGYRCSYVARQIGVKAKFGLTITPAEKEAMQRVLQACPQQSVPTGGGVTESSLREPAPRQPAVPPVAGSPGLDPRYSTCREAKAAGLGPYVRERDPEYAWYRDANANGVVCE